MSTALHIGFLLFPHVTQLDLTGPAQILSRVPGAQVHLVWKTRDPVPTDVGFTINPTTAFADCPPLDVLCVPGGFGIEQLFGDRETLAFLRRQGESARYVTSVCNGSLVLGAAGCWPAIGPHATGCGCPCWTASAPCPWPGASCATATASRAGA